MMYKKVHMDNKILLGALKQRVDELMPAQLSALVRSSLYNCYYHGMMGDTKTSFEVQSADFRATARSEIYEQFPIPSLLEHFDKFSSGM